MPTALTGPTFEWIIERTTDMRIGNPTKAHSESIPSSDVSALRNPLDANHIAAWYLDSYDGNQFPSAIPGSGSLWCGSSAVTSIENSMFKYAKAATLSTDATGYAVASGSSFTPVAASDNVTIEAIMWIPTNGFTALERYHNVVGIQVDPQPGSFMNLRIRQEYAYQFNYPSDSYFGGSHHYWDQIYQYGTSENLIAPCVAHHMMWTWNSSNVAKYYLDGWQLGTNTNSSYWQYPREAAMSNAWIVLSRDLYLADYRISNIERPQSYAIAATRAMRRL